MQTCNRTKLDMNGNNLWQSNGVKVGTARVPINQLNANGLWWEGPSIGIVIDGTDGAIIVWPDLTSIYGHRELFAQRIDGDGNIKWGYNGKQISSAGYSSAKYPLTPAVASDGNGGTFILWMDQNATAGGGRIVAKRIDNNGNFPWGASERVIFENPGWWGNPVYSVISDGQGGGIVSFGNGNPCHGYAPDIYIQRFDSAGNTLWTPKGVNASNQPSADWEGQLVPDGNGGIVIAWQNESDYRYIYAQHVSKNGQISGERTVAPPTNLEITKGGDNVSLTWNLSLNDAQIVGYNIYRALNSGTFSYIGSVKAGVTTFTDLTVAVDLDYCYIVRASNGCEESADSNHACTISNHPPIANASPDQVIECAGPSGSSVMLDASASTDPDGDPLTYIWTWATGVAEGINPTVTVPLGTTVITLTVRDSKSTATATVNITVRDTISPTTTATGGKTGWYNTNVTSTFTAYDSCSGVKEIHYNVNGSETVIPGSNASLTIVTEGIYSIAYFAVDNAGTAESPKTLTLKIDKTPPVLNLSITPNILWPPDYKSIDVFVGGGTTDALSDLASVTFAVNDEYGMVQPSVSGFNTTIPLEAWREGTDNDGRRYTITATATDVAGNISVATTEVLVPHDQGN